MNATKNLQRSGCRAGYAVTVKREHSGTPQREANRLAVLAANGFTLYFRPNG